MESSTSVMDVDSELEFPEETYLRCENECLQQQVNRRNERVANHRQAIWAGVLEFQDKSMINPDELSNIHPNITRQVPCYVTFSKDKTVDLKTELWPTKLVMQLLPRQMISAADNNYLKKAHSVLFHLQPCKGLDTLTKLMTYGLAGCVQFNNPNPAFELKILVILYIAEKNMFLGFILAKQSSFVDRLSKEIDTCKNPDSQQHQIQVTQNQNPVVSQDGLTPDLQNQANHLGGGMLQNPNMNNSMIGGQSYMAMAQDLSALGRQENLATIQRLQQQPPAAQQQEEMYQKIEELIIDD